MAPGRNIVETKQVLKSQYHAALEMLWQSIARCPVSLWNDPADKNRFWHVAYHALFYTHLYLHDREDDFEPWSGNRPKVQFLGRLPWPPYEEPEIGEPYTPAELLDYCSFCGRKVEQHLDDIDLAGDSGFDWLPFGKLELQLYSIRHIQHHTGELMERLGSRAGVDVPWIGRQD